MIRIKDHKQINSYIEKYAMGEIFSKDMKPYMELLYYKKNEHIIKESDEFQYLLFLVKGKAKVYVTLSNGKSLLHCFYQGFKVLGDLEIIDMNHARSNIQVIEDTYCIGISFDNVRRYLLEDAKFLRFICSALGEKLYQCSKSSSINLLYSLENRLASYIITTGERIDYKSCSRLIFNENLTEIAELLGTSYRHLLRTLNALGKKEVIKKKNGYYEVIDLEALKELSSDLYH